MRYLVYGKASVGLREPFRRRLYDKQPYRGQCINC
jgi:hypothetical protein